MAEARELTISVVLFIGILVTYLFQHWRLAPPSPKTRLSLKVQGLYFYPVKSLRGCHIKTAKIGPLGFEDDRSFSLQKVHRDAETKAIKRYETICIGSNLQTVLFSTMVEEDGGEKDVVVSWTGPQNNEPLPGHQAPWNGQNMNQIRFRLRPSVEKLKKIHIDVHGATTNAFDMGEDISAWFSKYLGFETRLAYIGKYSRPVLGSGAPNSDLAVSKRLPTPLYHLRQLVLPSFLGQKPERISFADVAQFLVVTTESNAELSRRIRENSDDPGLEMDITKFRPNIVLSGGPAAFDEDYWAELSFADDIRMAMTGNCWRCQSITADYSTGETAVDASGLAWKKLSRDRKVDKGWKYSPVFGRYGFCRTSDTGKEVRLGDKVLLTRRNKEHTVFDWPFSKN